MTQKSLKILLAEDNRVNQLYIKTVLQKSNHQVSLSDDGAQAVRMFKEDTFDLVLMDIQMPELDGYEAAAQIRAYEDENQLVSTPIIALTAYSDSDQNPRAEAARFDGHLLKPINHQALRKALEELSSESTPSDQGGHAAGSEGTSQEQTYHQKLLEDFAGVEDTLKAMVEMALKDLPLRWAELKESLRQEEWKKAKEKAHVLANIVGALHRSKEREAALELERILDNKDADRAWEMLEQLDSALHRTEDSFKQLREKL